MGNEPGTQWFRKSLAIVTTKSTTPPQPQQPKYQPPIEYFSMRNNSKQFPISSGISIKDFEILKLVGKGRFAQLPIWQVESKKNKQIYALTIFKKKNLIYEKQINTKTEC
eukprot:156967_1